MGKVKRKVEVRPFSGKKTRSTKKKSQISPVVFRSSLKRQNEGISNDSVVYSSNCFLGVDDDNVSCGSSRVEKSSSYSRKRRIDDVKDTLSDLKFRRITRSYSKLEKEKEREVIELSKSSCVESDSVDDDDGLRSAKSKENDEISFTRSNLTFADSRNLNFEKESDVVSRVECCSSSRFGSVTGGFGNEGIEISKPINFPGDYFVAKEDNPEVEISNLACTEQFSNNEVSDYFSSLDSSDYTPSIFFDSGSKFSEKSLCDSTPSHTHSLFLEFKNQFWRSKIPNDVKVKPSFADEHQDIRPEVTAEFEDEEVEESYQRLRERERNHAYLQGYGKTYYNGIDQSDRIPHLRLILVQWIVNQCKIMELQKETLFLGVSLLDQFLNKGSFKSQRSLLIVGIACLTLATRIEENQIVNTVQRRKFYIQDEKFSRSEVVAMEWVVQEVLNFRCISPTIYNFLWFYLEAAKANPLVESKAKSLAVIALSDHSLLRYWPSTLAATLVILACIQNNNEHEAYTRVIEIHVRTKDNNLPECVKSLEWLLGQ